MTNTSLVPAERIERSILLLREQKVMLDADLAELYGVDTRTLIQAVQRNRDRFPEDFMFQLTREEFGNLRSQTVISSPNWVVDDTRRTRSPSRAWPCYRAFSEATEPST